MDITLCIDAIGPQQSGIGRYAWELSKGLRKHRSVDRLYYYSSGRLIDDPEAQRRDGHSHVRSSKFLRRWTNWRTRRVLQDSLVHGPNYFLPAGVGTGLITVHDLSVFRFPESHPLERIAAFEREFAASLERAAHFITDTETVRRELIDTLAVAPEAVTAVPLGVDNAYRPRPSQECSSFLDRHHLRYGGYGLSVSTIEPRKRIDTLLAAWRRLPSDIRSRFPLVLAGGAGWRNEDLLQQIGMAEREGWLRHLGFVSEEDLPLLYAGASLFIYPSIYEGFGLPPLEAMASGIPVIVANRSCLPEVAGDAAMLIDPDDADAFLEAVRRGLEDSEWRGEAARLGLARAAQFTWRRCVDETVAVYHKAAVSARS